MSIRRSPDQLYRSARLSAEPWLTHAFGTAAASPPEPYLLLKQVHSARVIDAADWHDGIEADALTTATPGLPVAVKTADCVPILLADPVRRAVAAVHAGWRGTISGIAGAAVDEMRQRYGTRPADLIAAFGPSIQSCCFEVGADVGEQFRSIFPERHTWRDGDHADLQEANRRILVRAGLDPARITTAGACTCCGGPEFHSWRRDRTAGCRMYASIAVLA